MGQIKELKGKIIFKHETAADWEKSDYVPNFGEKVLYDPDEMCSYTRTKYGDGEKTVKDLPFASPWKNGEHPTALKLDTLSVASGKYSIALGQKNESIGENSFTEGYNNQATGDHSHAEGENTIADGYCSHAEGRDNLAGGVYSHAEGRYAEALGGQSHAEGWSTKAAETCAHAEGWAAQAIGKGSHAEGNIIARPLGRVGSINIDEEANIVNIGIFYDERPVKDFDTVLIASKIYNISGWHYDSPDVPDDLIANSIVFENCSSELMTELAAIPVGIIVERVYRTIASNVGAHAEGVGTQAQGHSSHAEGNDTIAIGEEAHAEGWETIADADKSHAEGRITHAMGHASHAEGNLTTAKGDGAHSEGYGTLAHGSGAHAEGLACYTDELWGTITAIDASEEYTRFTMDWAEGFDQYDTPYYHPMIAVKSAGKDVYRIVKVEATNIEGDYPGETWHIQIDVKEPDTAAELFAVGDEIYTAIENQAIGAGAHTEGWGTKSLSHGTHAEGRETEASGVYAHAEGRYSIASGGQSHAEGWKTTASETCAHAEGWETQATGKAAHSEGRETVASGERAHAEGYQTQAIGENAHAGGYKTEAIGKNSFAHGESLTTSRENQFVVGQHNKRNDDALFMVGYNGTNILESEPEAFRVIAGSTDESNYTSLKLSTEDGIRIYHSHDPYGDYRSWVDIKEDAIIMDVNSAQSSVGMDLDASIGQVTITARDTVIQGDLLVNGDKPIATQQYVMDSLNNTTLYQALSVEFEQGAFTSSNPATTSANDIRSTFIPADDGLICLFPQMESGAYEFAIARYKANKTWDGYVAGKVSSGNANFYQDTELLLPEAAGKFYRFRIRKKPTAAIVPTDFADYKIYAYNHNLSHCIKSSGISVTPSNLMIRDIHNMPTNSVVYFSGSLKQEHCKNLPVYGVKGTAIFYNWKNNIRSNAVSSGVIIYTTDTKVFIKHVTGANAFGTWIELAQAKETIDYELYKTIHKFGVIGDSLSVGWINGERRNEAYSWPKRIGADSGAIVELLGQGGYTTQRWLNSYESEYGAHLLESAQYHCPVYLIALGYNDASTNENIHVELGAATDIASGNTTTFYGGYAEIIRRVQATVPGCITLCMTIPNPDANRAAYNQAIRNIVIELASNQVLLVEMEDFNDEFKSGTSIGKQSLEGHYTASGYQAIAKIVEKAISKTIDNNFEAFKTINQIMPEIDGMVQIGNITITEAQFKKMLAFLETIEG